MQTIQNPILRGFHPDPSIIRVEDDYYIAVSTFEWFPGVLIYHSRDLMHWEFCTAPLRRVSQMDLRGVPNSCGIFAPCLSYCDGAFYLVYTIVKTNSIFQDTDNYLVTARDISGEWSEPIYLNSTGFDPSLFHDRDGRKWLLNRDCDTRSYLEERDGILMREYDPEEQRLVGREYRIYRNKQGTGAEGAHLYYREGYYYLLTAEGGTDYNHRACLARSRSILGPYESDPDNPFLTSMENPWNPLQKAGHASLVSTQSGEWYIVHLAGRPIPTKGTCILGRETCLQKVYWNEAGWLRLAQGGKEPALEVAAPAGEKPLSEILGEKGLWREERMADEYDDFTRETLGYPYQTLRVPLDENVVTLKARRGVLRIYGRDSLHSRYQQALVARRQQAFCFSAETCMEYSPENYHQMAGLICMYDTDNFYYLYVTRAENGERKLNVMVSVLGEISYPLRDGIELPEGSSIRLRTQVAYDRMYFSYAVKDTYQRIERCFDYSILSDDFYYQRGEYRFTGAFVGICCQDCYDRKSYADFHFFHYRETAMPDFGSPRESFR
mgnify:CR=1 FL=1